MTRSNDFSSTVKHGRKAVQPHVVIYLRHATGETKLGLIVSRAVGSAVQRHSLSRRLRHVARDVVAHRDQGAHIVVRALPNSGRTTSAELDAELRAGIRHLDAAGSRR